MVALTPPTAAASSPGRALLRKKTTPQTNDTTAGQSGSPARLSGSPRFGGDGGGGSHLCRSLVLDPTSPQKDTAVTSSPSPPSTAIPGTVPRTDWLSAAVSARRRGGSIGGEGEGAADGGIGSGQAADAVGMVAGVAGGRDAKLSSVLALSPGKEYWTGRIAGRGLRGSTSPPAKGARNKEMTKRKEKNNNHTFGGVRGGATVSPPWEVSTPSSPPVRVEECDGSRALGSPPGCQQQQQHHQQQKEEASGSGGVFSVGSSAGTPKKKDYLSFTAGKRGAPLSPGGASSTTASVRSIQQAFGSPGGSPVAGSLGWGTGRRLDPRSWRSLQLEEVRSPPSPSSHQETSPLFLSLSPARGHRRRGISPASRRIALEDNSTVAGLPAVRLSGRASPPIFSPAGGGGSSFGTPPSFRLSSSPGQASLGTGFGGGSPCSFSSLQTQVTKRGGGGEGGA